MIVFDLQCDATCGTFEAWFRSGVDYEEQHRAGLVRCPICRSAQVSKAPMAPRVPKKGDPAPLARLAAAQAAMLEQSQWVGEKFADTARAMHSGDIEPTLVHGSATPDQARSLMDDGIPVAPLPLPVTPPNQVN